MKTIKQFVGSALLCLLELIAGVLLLVDPITFTSGIIMACGIVLLLFGLGSIIQYFRMDAEEAATSQGLMKGILLLLLGWLCTFKTQWFLVTFPLLTFVYGVAILISGLGKLQWAVDMLRMKKEKWYLAAVGALLSVICAVVILCNPFSSTEVLWIFTGITLICEAKMDLVTFFMNRKQGTEKAVDSKEIEEVVGEAVNEVGE